MYIGNMINQPVKAGGGDILHQSRRAVLGANHIDDLIALLPFFKYLWNAGRWVLQIRIHADHYLPGAVIHAGNHGRLMAEVPGKADDFYPFLRGGQAFQYGQAAVRAAVIDKNQLPIPAGLFQHAGCFPVKFIQRFFLIVNGNYNGNRFIHGSNPVPFSVTPIPAAKQGMRTAGVLKPALPWPRRPTPQSAGWNGWAPVYPQAEASYSPRTPR